jgi:hypothetical protein
MLALIALISLSPAHASDTACKITCTGELNATGTLDLAHGQISIDYSYDRLHETLQAKILQQKPAEYLDISTYPTITHYQTLRLSTDTFPTSLHMPGRLFLSFVGVKENPCRELAAAPVRTFFETDYIAENSDDSGGEADPTSCLASPL